MKNLKINDKKFDDIAMFEIILALKARYNKNKQLMYNSFMVEELYDMFFKKENTSETQLEKDLDKLEEDYCKVLKKEELAGLVTYDYELESFYANINNRQADPKLKKYTSTYGEDKVNTIKKYVIKHNK